MSDDGLVYKNLRFMTDPDLPQDVIVILSQPGNVRETVDLIAKQAAEILGIEDWKSVRQYAWRSLIEAEAVHAVVGIDWGVSNGESNEAEDEDTEDEDTEG